MKELGEQWIEVIDGKKHIVKAVKGLCENCGVSHLCNLSSDCPMAWGLVGKDLGILNDNGLLPCPFCGEYPESFNKGNEYTRKRGSVLKCNKCHYELTVCAIYQTIEWCKEKVLYNWNRRSV